MPSSNSGNGSTSSVDLLDSKIPGAFPNVSSSAISTHQTLSQAVYARRSEYTRPRKIRIKVGTWNVAAFKGTERDVGGWFVDGKGVEEAMTGLSISGIGKSDLGKRESVEDQESRKSKKESTIPKNDHGSVPGGEEIGIYALGLQEIVDINSAAEALRPYTDPSPSNRFKAAIQEALPLGYELIAEQQLIGLLLLVYVSPKIVSEVKSISTTSVGTGVMGVMGNKGAVTTRLVLGETTRIVFINSHLAAGAGQAALDRRNWDASQIANRTKFDPIVDSMGSSQAAEPLGQEDFAFWFGDLNYRLEGMSGEDVRHLLTLHTRGEYGTAEKPESSPEKCSSEELQDSSISQSCSSASSTTDKFSDCHSQHSTTTEDASTDALPTPAHLDPTSLHTTLSSLLAHDELHQQQKARKAFHDGWREGPLEFLPTYKYDVGSVGSFDSSEKKRCPSWCDRILYRTRRDKLAYDAMVEEEEEAKKKDEEMKARGMTEANVDEEVLFDYNPETDGDEYDEYVDAEPEVVITKEGFQDELFLEYYTAHQRVISSDHKPLDAVFVLKYDAVVPDLKARVHQEVARELDRAENEGRPTITLIIEKPSGSGGNDTVNNDAANWEGVDFGDVRYSTSKRRSITIANTGSVQATISFVDRPVTRSQPEGPTPPWLSVIFDRKPDTSPSVSNRHKQYTIEPGEVCNVELKLLVDAIDIVRGLNNDVTELEDILVLRVENGRDHFLPVRGRWLQSSFGRSIDKLIRIPEGGIRRLQRQKPTGDDQGVMWSAPRELFRLTESVEDLVERTLAEWDMTNLGNDKPPWQNNAGWPFEEESWYKTSSAARDALRPMVYEALDCDQPFESAFDVKIVPIQRLEILAETLIIFLRSLEDGIVTEGLWERLESGMVARERAKQQLSLEDERTWVLEVLSLAPSYNVSFVLLTSMLSRIAVEIANSIKPSETPRSSVELPASPKVAVRRKTLSQIPEVARMQLISRNFAAIFSGVMIRAPELGKGKDKEKRAREERMTRVIAMFLSEGGVVPGG